MARRASKKDDARMPGRGLPASVEKVLVHLAPATLFVLIALAIVWRILGANGVFVNGDLERPTDLQGLWHYLLPLWSETESTSVITRLPQLLYYLPFFAVGALFGLDTTGLLTFMFVTSQALMGISMFYLSWYILRRSYGIRGSAFDWRVWSAALIAGFVYMWSSYPAFHILHPAIRGAFSIAPLVLLSLLVGLERRKMRYIVLAGFLWSVCCADIHWMVYGAIFVFCPVLFDFVTESVRNYRRHPKKGMLRSLKAPFVLHLGSLLVVLGSFLAFSAYWFVPGLLMKGTSMFTVPLRDEYIEMWYQDATMVNVINNQATGSGSPEVYVASSGPFASGPMQAALAILGFGVFMAAILAVALRPKAKNVRFFSLFLLLSIVISTGMDIFPQLSLWLMREAPLHDLYGWAFRTPKFSEFITFSLVGLLGFSVFELVVWAWKKGERSALTGKARKVAALAVVALLLCSAILPNWPLTTGNMNDALRPANMPDEFKQLDDWFSQQGGDFKVLWLPNYASRGVFWNEGLRTHMDMGALSSSRPSYVYDTPNMNPNGYGIYFLEATVKDDNLASLLAANMSGDIGKVLAPLNIRYIVFHDDNATTTKEASTGILEALKAQSDLKLVETFGILYVFENECYRERTGQRFFATSTTHLVFGGISSMDMLTEIPTFVPWSDGIVFGGQAGLDRDLINATMNDIIFTQGTGPADLAFESIGDEYLITPYNFVSSYEPDARWSKTPIYEFSNGRNNQKGDLSEWNWDRGMGVVYTWSKGTPRADQTLTDKDLVRSYDFNEDMGDFTTTTPNIGIALENAPASGGSVLKGTVTIGEPGIVQEARMNLIPTVKKSLDYRVSFSFSVQDANNAQVVVSSYDIHGQPLRDQYLLTKSGTSRMELFASNVSFPFGTEYFSIRVLADRNPINDSFWRLDDLKVYDLGNLIVRPKMKLDFDVKDTGMQDIYIRCLMSSKGGRMNLNIDGKPFGTVVTQDPTGAFEWVKAGSLTMSSGHHSLVVENAVGFNLVNLVSVIPKERFDEELRKAQELMDGKGVILAFEAEHSLARNSPAGLVPSVAFGNAAGMGKVVKLSADEARASFEVPRSGNYTLSMRLAGHATENLLAVRIGDTERLISYNASDVLTWVNITPVRLEAGIQGISFFLPELGERSGTLSFEDGLNATTGVPVGCNPQAAGFDASLDGATRTDGKSALRLNTGLGGPGNWSGMMCGEVPVDGGRWYKAGVDVKTSNVVQSQVLVYGYDEELAQYVRLQTVVSALSWTNDWSRHSTTFRVPSNVTKVTFVLNAGGVQDPSLGNATTWFDNITLDRYYKDLRTDLDMFFLNQDPHGGTLEDMFGRPPVAVVKDYKRLDDGHYQVDVSSTGQFVLGFAETYDAYWSARTQDGRDLKGLPLNGMVNGYSVNRTGNFTIILEYQPQSWFNVGAVITATSATIGLVWLLWVTVVRRRYQGCGITRGKQNGRATGNDRPKAKKVVRMRRNKTERVKRGGP